MTKNEVIIELVRDHFNFTFEGDSEQNRKILFRKDEFLSSPIHLHNLSDLDVQVVKNEYMEFLKK